MDNLKLLFHIYLRPAAAMSDLIDRGSWIYAALIVLLISIAFSATINSKLDEAFRVPQFNEYYRVPDEIEDENAAEAEYMKASAEYEKAMAAGHQIPVVGDNFFKFAS